MTKTKIRTRVIRVTARMISPKLSPIKTSRQRIRSPILKTHSKSKTLKPTRKQTADLQIPRLILRTRPKNLPRNKTLLPTKSNLLRGTINPS